MADPWGELSDASSFDAEESAGWQDLSEDEVSSAVGGAAGPADGAADAWADLSDVGEVGSHSTGGEEEAFHCAAGEAEPADGADGDEPAIGGDEHGHELEHEDEIAS